MYCPACGTFNEATGNCRQCQAPLPKPIAPPQVNIQAQVSSPSAGQNDSVISTIIPYKNGYALAAYYLAVFSLIPFVGILLGLAAFGFGIKGLSFAKKNPGAKGQVHAWIGVLVGGLFGFGYLFLTIFLIYLAASQHQGMHPTV